MLPIFLVVLVDVFGLTLVIPLLAIYAESFGATPVEATLLVSVYAACQLVSGPMLGRASDMVGRKPMLLISQVGTLIGFLVMANAKWLWMLYLARVIDGATAGNLSLAQAWISDNTKPEHRTRSFALIGIAFGLGFFVGPWVTGELASYGLRAPIYLAAAMSLTSILCTAFLLPSEKGKVRARAPAVAMPGGRRLGVLDWGSYAPYFKRPALATRLYQFFLFALSFSMFTSGFALFAERMYQWKGHAFGPREVGYVFAYSGFLGIILQGGIIGRLAKRFGDSALVVSGFFSAAIGYAVLGVFGGFVGLAMSATIGSYGNGVLRPALTSLVSQAADATEQGVVIGLTQSLNSLAAIIAPTVGGLLLEHHALSGWAFVAAGGSAVGLLLARRARHLVTAQPVTAEPQHAAGE